MQAAHLPMPAAPAEHIADTAITAVIEQMLATKKGLTSLLITVQTQESIVQITGFADNLLAQQRAEEIVQAVCRLHSTLCMRLDTLRPNAADPDQALAERIRIYARYNWSSDLHGQEVDVRIKDGRATLTGTIDTWLDCKDRPRNARGRGSRSQ